MSSFSELANRKVAGVPVLYLAAAFVTILAIVAWKMKPTVTEDLGPVDESGGDAAGAAKAADYSDLATQGTVTVVQGTPEPQEAVKQTNDDWERAAVDYLVTAKLASPSVAQAAIHAYLEGANLSFDQGKLKDAAITKLKLPPEPLATIGTIGTAPAQKQFSNFPGRHTVKGSNDNTPAKLAALYYGSGDSLHANKIVAANNALGPVGTTYNTGVAISIPAWTTPRYATAKHNYNYPGQISSKNGISYGGLLALNPGMLFPVKYGTQVRVA